MNMKQTAKQGTFVRYDKVNGRSYKTVRVRPHIGPKPSIQMYEAEPKPAEMLVIADVVPKEESLDTYSEVNIEASLDSDALDSREAGIMRGYMNA